ncbi:hypothetical protein [Halogranum rubrum]|uniref:Uncharacterized protein n=1 Tax=Halogranum salarium B-1 TaxID=1210908 RepID=J3A0B7_9EURY|nr:hypothetical protein [Halogranum salarium]EJN58768.1 hypothetical protein HSB1_28490 [Halogranum salarium B-1]
MFLLPVRSGARILGAVEVLREVDREVIDFDLMRKGLSYTLHKPIEERLRHH